MSLIGTVLRRLFGGHATPPESAAVRESPGTAPGAASSDWFVSDEEREQERIVERVCERLEAGVVRVDAKGQRLIWRPKRRALTLAASIRRLEKRLPDCDPDEIEEAVLYWLEQVALPENVTEERMDRHEVRIERWIEAHHERVDGG